MTENINTGTQTSVENINNDDPQMRGGGDSQITENDDEDVLENDTDAPKMDDLEDIDLDADMDDDDYDDENVDDDDDTSGGSETQGNP